MSHTEGTGPSCQWPFRLQPTVRQDSLQLLYQLSQKDCLGHEKTIYLKTEQDTETKQDKERKTLLVPGDIVQKEHLDLFEEDGWADVGIKISAHSENPPSVWVEQATLL